MGILLKSLEDLGYINNYIKYDIIELFLYYILFLYCNIYIDYLWYNFSNFEYVCKYIN